jgi:hypothetical protein
VFYHNAYIWLTLALFGAAAVQLRRSAVRAGESHDVRRTTVR